MADTTTEERLETQPEGFEKPIVLTLKKRRKARKRDVILKDLKMPNAWNGI